MTNPTNTNTVPAAPATIRTTADAEAWIAANGYRPTIEGGYVVETHVCKRCGGTGIYSEWHGVCYECHGVDSRRTVRIPVKAWAQNRKRLDRASAKRDAERTARHEARLERQRDIVEAETGERLTFDEAKAKRAEARAARREAEKAEKQGQCPEGRVTVTGRVVKCEVQENEYGTRRVFTVLCNEGIPGGEFLVWGTVPSALSREVYYEHSYGNGDFAWTESVVTFTATVTRSDRDPAFGFAKRPSKAAFVSVPVDVAKPWNPKAVR